MLINQRLILITGTILGTCLGVNPGFCQITPDGSTDTSVVNDCRSSCQIVDGVVAGDNLFHSFREFNIDKGERVYFADPGVANIFSRVSGNNLSEIFGILGVTGGDANLFLLNPNGIVFGQGATLDLNGSFFATTADQIQFGEHLFSAIPNAQENLALLTLDPSALFFKQMGQNGSIVVEGGKLTLPATKNLTLLGQSDRNPGLFLKNAQINVAEGNISLGAVQKNADNQAKISIDKDFQLEFPRNVQRGDITLSESTKINATNANNPKSNEIQIEADNFKLIDNAKISTLATGTSDGADININAQGAVKIIGEDSEVFQEFVANNFIPGGYKELPSGLQTATSVSGNAGNIKITTPNLLIDNGTGVISSTRSLGKSGNLKLEVADSFTLKGSGLLTGSTAFTPGDVGEISIKAKQLFVQENGIISSSTLGDGSAGNLNIAASEIVAIGNPSDNLIIPPGVYTNTVFGNGVAGDLKIDTPRLILQHGGQLSASSGAIIITENGLSLIPLGERGNIDLNIAESLKITGKTADGNFTSRIITDTRSNYPTGNLTINTGDLDIDSDGLISASSIGNGVGGNILINARKGIRIDGPGVENLRALLTEGLTGNFNLANVKGGIAAFTINRGAAGDITINTSELDLNHGAMITTATYGADNAGNLQINASKSINVESSAIISPTFGTGDGGQLTLETQNLSVDNGGAIASASVGSGRSGDINIRAAESITISEQISDLLFSGSISTGNYMGVGLSGDLHIDTQRLSVFDGASIQTNNISLNPAINLTTIDPSEITGVTPGKLTINATKSIRIGNQTNQTTATPRSFISSTTNTPNPASDVIIKTGKLSVFNGGEISVNSLGNGAAGKLAIAADSLVLTNASNLNGTTRSGQGGNIILEIDNSLILQNASVIDTNAIAFGNGGNIDIDANFVIASGNSAISANAAEIGNGGNIRITANDIFLSPDSLITADSALGINGTIKFKTLVANERNNYTALPQQVIQTDSKITRSCGNKGDRQGEFSYIGRGGLPFNPLTELPTDNIGIADFESSGEMPIDQITPEQAKVNQQLDSAPRQTIEANQWRVNEKGKVELIAAQRRSLPFDFAPSICPFATYK